MIVILQRGDVVVSLMYTVTTQSYADVVEGITVPTQPCANVWAVSQRKLV